jgi:hypothetical protein
MRSVILLVAVAVGLLGRPLQAQQPDYLRDRGPGVRMSILGTYIAKGELVLYPFFEWYSDHDTEYKPRELGYGTSGVDYRGRFRASEGIFFIGYGLSEDIALEFEAAVITAEQRTSPLDTSTGRPAAVKESGLGDVEGQIRWRVQRESETRPEIFTFFETVFPLQKDKHIIGTQEWEFAAGFGITRGFNWGTLTFRASAEYSAKVFDTGEYAFEYMRRVSPSWRLIAALEGVQLDEVSFLGEVQWLFNRHARLKVNSGIGLTQNATDFAPEIGIMFNF